MSVVFLVGCTTQPSTTGQIVESTPLEESEVPEQKIIQNESEIISQGKVTKNVSPIDFCSSLQFDAVTGRWSPYKYEISITNLGLDIDEDVEISTIDNSIVIDEIRFIDWLSQNVKTIYMDAGIRTLRIKPASCAKGFIIDLNMPVPKQCSVTISDLRWSGNYDDKVFLTFNVEGYDTFEQNVTTTVSTGNHQRCVYPESEGGLRIFMSDSYVVYNDRTAIVGSSQVSKEMVMNIDKEHCEYTNQIKVNVSSSQCELFLKHYNLSTDDSIDGRVAG